MIGSGSGSPPTVENHHCGKWLGNILIYVVLLFGTLCMFVVM